MPSLHLLSYPLVIWWIIGMSHVNLILISLSLPLFIVNQVYV
jgi:hypothetical protein